MPEGTADRSQSESTQHGKRRRLQGSCDACRKKKVRCDSAEMPKNRCTNCIAFKTECTHARLKAGENLPATSPSVKTAQEHIANILSTSTVYIPPTDPHQVLVQVAQYARSLEERLAALQPQTDVPKSRSPMALSMEDASSQAVLAEPEPASPIIGDPLISLLAKQKKREMFYGKSSSVQFIKSVILRTHGDTSIVVGVQRPEFWTPQPWEKLIIESPQLVFPDKDLLASLVKIYFEQINPITGTLHFPSFRESVADDLHFRDHHFGAVVLVVCSLASRYSDDPRVFLDGVNSEHSCGWKWFRQVRPLRASFSLKPSLHQLQLIGLSVLYLAATANPEECWILAGLGLRFAQGAGAHHRSGYSRMKPLEAELYKRIFYLFLMCDTIISMLKGRPTVTYTVDFDLDLPVDCDEEYWGVTNAVQPPGKPSTSSFMVAYLPLIIILGRIQRAVYAVNEQPCSPDTIAELDSTLNKWVTALPEHLRWDPNQENQIFLDQSAALYASYYHAQILIHRPYIPAPGKESMSTTSFPSLAICANAARACGHVLDVQARRGRGILHHPQIMTILFDCAVVLLINVWAVVGGRNPRTEERYNRATADVRKCVRVLRLYERRWRFAGRKCDVISAMLSIGKFPSDAPSLKRPRDFGEETASPDVPKGSLNLLEDRPVAGSSRASSVAHQIHALELSIQETEHLFSLPLHTEELGRLPIYDSFDYEFTFQSNNNQYQPQSHLDSQYGEASLEPEFLYGGDPASEMDASFDSPSQNGGIPSGEEIQLDHPFDIPFGYGWRDWSTYLMNVDGLSLNQETL